MTSGDLKLGLAGSEVILPASHNRKLQINDIELKKVQTMASGKEVEDIIGYKKNFSISYEFLTGTDLDTVLDIYDLHADLSFIITNEDLSTTTYTGMILDPIPRIRDLCNASLWIWTSPVLNLRMRSCL